MLSVASDMLFTHELEQSVHGDFGADPAGRCPCDKFADIDASAAYFAVLYPALRFVKQLSQCTLGQVCFLPEMSEESRDRFISRILLCALPGFHEHILVSKRLDIY